MNITKQALMDTLVAWYELADAGGCAGPEDGLTDQDRIEASTEYVWAVLEQHPDTALDSVDMIASWITVAKPTPTDRDLQVQLGCHFEEVAEMLDAVAGKDETTAIALAEVKAHMEYLATGLKKGFLSVDIKDRKEFLDAACDQIVTATGSAHLAGMNVVEGIRRVNASNWSKFKPDGTAIFDENGKIAKNPETYFKCDLEGLY